MRYKQQIKALEKENHNLKYQLKNAKRDRDYWKNEAEKARDKSVPAVLRKKFVIAFNEELDTPDVYIYGTKRKWISQVNYHWKTMDAHAIRPGASYEITVLTDYVKDNTYPGAVTFSNVERTNQIERNNL